MKNFDLNAFGVNEMSEIQARDLNGGLIIPYLIVVKLFELGYNIGAVCAAEDSK